MKKSILWIMVSTLLVILILTGCSNNKNDNKNDNTNIDKTANSNSQSIVYFMSGKVKADESADITSKITARVSDVSVDVGSAVNKGDYIIKLDSKDLEAQVEQQQAAVNVAEANLNKIKSGARTEQIDQAEAAFESAKTNYENTKTTNETNKDLYNAGGISKSQLDQSETTLAAAEASYKSAQYALDMLKNGETSETIAIYEAQLKSAQAGLATAQVQLQNGTITSPISGVVTEKNIKEGELATVGTPLLTIVNLDTVVINAYVPSTYINKIALNQEVIIKVSEIPDKEFTGEISVINSATDSKSKDILVKVKFKEKDPLLKPGMFAEIGIRE